MLGRLTLILVAVLACGAATAQSSVGASSPPSSTGAPPPRDAHMPSKSSSPFSGFFAARAQQREAVRTDMASHGCTNLPWSPDGWLCRDWAQRDVYERCVAALKQILAVECRADWKIAPKDPDVVIEKPAAGSDILLLSTQSSMWVTVRKGQRGQGSFGGSAGFKVAIAQTGIPQPSCDPTAAAALGANCAIDCYQQRYTVAQRGTSGFPGMFAMSGPNAPCSSPVSNSAFAPSAEDLYYGYDACAAGGKWGGTAQISLPIRGGVQMITSRKHVWATPGGAKMENKAAVIQRTTLILLPMTVTCANG